MAGFWVGTVPMMALIGVSAQRLLGPFRSRLPVLTAVALVVLGAFTVAGRFTGSGMTSGLGTTPAGAGHDHHSTQ